MPNARSKYLVKKTKMMSNPKLLTDETRSRTEEEEEEEADEEEKEKEKEEKEDQGSSCWS